MEEYLPLFHAREVVLDSGTRSLVPDIPGLARIDTLHAGNSLDRPELPGHVVFLGAGYIALKMGQFYRRMGSRVTILERSRSLLKREDEDVTSALQAVLESEGIAFRLGARVTRVAGRGKGVTVEVAGGGRVNGTHLFVATGRRPNTDDLGLASVGLRRGRDGTVPVNERLQTSVPGLWAAGDIRGGPMFTHSAWDDFRILESQMQGDSSRTTARIVPYAVYTDPELGRVGMTEREAIHARKKIRVGRFPMRANGKALELGETGGFIKVVVDARTDRILAAAVLSAEGAELVRSASSEGFWRARRRRPGRLRPSASSGTRRKGRNPTRRGIAVSSTTSWRCGPGGGRGSASFPRWTRRSFSQGR